MRAVFQRVDYAKLFVDGELVSKIDRGLMVMLGVTFEDEKDNLERMAYRIATTRLFRDENDKLNLSVQDVNGSVLLISNFTLCATKKGGTRPDFSISAPKEKALKLYEDLAETLRNEYKIDTKLGRFGEHMEIESKLNGPITLYMET